MAVAFETQTRDEFILFGSIAARVLQGIVSLEGVGDSGKSLLALAADYELHPERYPQGLISTTKVHKQIGIDAKERESVFFSDGLSEFFTPRVVATRWLKFLKRNPQIKIAYLSNVWNWTSDSIDPKDPAVFAENKVPVQTRINVSIIDTGEFVRRITLNCVKPELEQIIKTRFEEALRLSQPATPKHREAMRQAKPSGNDAV